ncbi:MAG: hypothetical protein JNN29_13520 [Chitinophagaceae bacterium]|nr:hypothetical protein [Chitinophagaceae bacterium]
MKKMLLLTTLSLILLSCKEKKKNDFFPVLSFLQSQVKHVDTSVYNIQKIVPITDSTADTTSIPREQFRAEAADFLSIPDLTEGRFTDKYEQREGFEQEINRAILSYYPKAGSKNLEIIRQDVVIIPTTTGNDQVRTLFIDRIKEYKDSTVLQKLFWTTDESFKVLNIVQKTGQPDRVSQKELVWNRPLEEKE